MRTPGNGMSGYTSPMKNTNEYRVSHELQPTYMGSDNFTTEERMIFAITDDDVDTFSKLSISLDDLANLRFDTDLNVLNFAIDQERVSIVKYLALITAERPDI